MYSLVKFHNETCSVVLSKKVQHINKKMCIANCNGGKYSAFFIKKSDDKSHLQELKNKNRSFKPQKNTVQLHLPCDDSDSSYSSVKTNHKIYSNEEKSDEDSQNSTTNNSVYRQPQSSEMLCNNNPSDSFQSVDEKILSSNEENREEVPQNMTKSNSECGQPQSFSCKSKLVNLFENSPSYKDSQEKTKQKASNNLLLPADTSQNNFSIENKETIFCKPRRVNEAIESVTLQKEIQKSTKQQNVSNEQSTSSSNTSALHVERDKDNPPNIESLASAKEKNIVKNYSQSTPLDLTVPKNYTKEKYRFIKPINIIFPSSASIRRRAMSVDSLVREKILDFETPGVMSKNSKQFSNRFLLNPLENNKTSPSNESFERIETADTDPSKHRNERCFSTSFNSSTNNHNSTLLSEISSSEDNLGLISANMEESTASEYNVDSSVDASIGLENSKNLSENNRSVDVIETPIDITKIIVPVSKNDYKKHFCIFCHTLQCKISRHIFLKHKNEAVVKRASLMPVKSKERLKIIADLRKKGDFLHNTSAEFNSGILIVPRRQQKKFKNLADDYICCKKCKGFFSKRTLRIHISKCANSKNSRTNFIDGRRLTQFIHPVSNEILKCKVFPTLRNDFITKAIRYDELIIKFGNKLTEKYTAQHQHDMIRANLRLLGRFKIQLIKLEPDIKELKQIFRPQYFDKCISAVRATANWDNKIMGFKTPAVAQNITSLIKKCAKKQRAEFIKEQNEELKTQLDNFLLLWEEETPTVINKKALEDQTNKKRDKKVIVPTKDDIKKLYIYLKTLINKSMKTLLSGFCMSAWTELVKTTLIFIQIFNRRRAGEIERLTIANFANKEAITDSVDRDILKNLSGESIKFAKQFVRITLRGKLGRTVSVLLCPMSIKAIELILKYRLEAGITEENNFIFSKPTISKLAKQYFRACPLLKKFSEECDAQIPESLRGTSLRKQIATYTSLLNVEEASVDKLANFMGHHKDIHKNIYRVSVPVAEITCISKLLMSAINDEEDEEDNITEGDDDNGDGDENEHQNKNVENVNTSVFTEPSYSGDSFEDVDENPAQPPKKRRSTSPFGKTKRIRWNSNEKDAIFSAFGNIQDLTNLPTLKQCLEVISSQPVLSKRTPQQVKSWIDNQRRYNKPDDPQ